jgi:hypothetical protein
MEAEIDKDGALFDKPEVNTLLFEFFFDPFHGV